MAYVPHKGWFWYIPLHSDVVSVGIVADSGYLYRDTRDLNAIYAREVQSCVWIQDHVKVGTQIEPVRVTGEYTYKSRHIGGDGFCLVGDAFSFLDPLYSSGVCLALKSGEIAADTVHAALDAGDVTAKTFEEYEAKQRQAVGNFRQLVMAFYDPTFSFREFLEKYPHFHALIVDTLVGNVYKDLTELLDALDEFAKERPREEISDAVA